MKLSQRLSTKEYDNFERPVIINLKQQKRVSLVLLLDMMMSLMASK